MFFLWLKKSVIPAKAGIQKNRVITQSHDHKRVVILRRYKMAEHSKQKTEDTCADCRFSTSARGRPPVLICNHKNQSHRKWLQVTPTGSCANFEHPGPDPALILAALAAGARLIPLTQGKVAIVDPADYLALKRYKWFAAKGRRTYYAARRARGRQIWMHRQILKPPSRLVVDHIDHNGLNNRRENLRPCTRRQNNFNQLPRRGGSSKYKGVTRCRRTGIFRAQISRNKKCIHIGRFKKEIDAAKAYDKKAKELFGEFAYLNFPPVIARSEATRLVQH